jgi:hypothetical protein
MREPEHHGALAEHRVNGYVCLWAGPIAGSELRRLDARALAIEHRWHRNLVEAKV